MEHSVTSCFYKLFICLYQIWLITVEWVNEISHILFIFTGFLLCYLNRSLRDYRVCCIRALLYWINAQQVGQIPWSSVHKPIHCSASCSRLLAGDLNVTLSCLVCLVLQESPVWLSRWAGGTACAPETPAPATTPAARDCAPSGSVWRGTAAWSWGPGRETSVRTPWRRCCPPLCTAASVNEAWRRRRTAWVSTGACISPCCTVRPALTHRIWWFCSREVGRSRYSTLFELSSVPPITHELGLPPPDKLNGEFQGEMKRAIIVSKIVKNRGADSFCSTHAHCVTAYFKCTNVVISYTEHIIRGTFTFKF